MRNWMIVTLLLGMAAGCASVSQYRIEDSLREIGLPSDKASCIGDQLRDRLDSDDLDELADFLNDLVRANSRDDGLDLVMEIDNPAVVGAVTASALSCAFAPIGN